MADKNKNIENLSEIIGINKSTFYRRMNNQGETFSIKEATVLSRELSLTEEEINTIFFAKEIA